MNKRFKFILRILIIWIVISILLQYAGKRIGIMPSEVKLMNYKFLQKKYDKFSFDTAIDDQLETSPYNKKTLIALDKLRSSEYNFYFAKKLIKNSIGDLHGYKELEIVEELDRIYDETCCEYNIWIYLDRKFIRKGCWGARANSNINR